MWQKTLAPLVTAGKIVAIGVVQEQHADRARLYRQWRELDWPIAIDSLNLLGHRAVPIPMGIDEHGVVRTPKLKPNEIEEFVALEFAAPGPLPKEFRATLPDPIALAARARFALTAESWFDLGDALFLFGGESRLGAAIDAYRRGLEREPNAARGQFRLGVALRRRHDSYGRTKGDAQAAVDAWGRALALDPGQYIWRRRIQQYGPRLDKPYNFYFWVEEARKEIRARGGAPISLSAEPRGSEIAPPRSSSDAEDRLAPKDVDPKRGLPVDRKRLVGIDTIVTPARIRPGERVRVRVILRLDAKQRPYWNNESAGLSVWAKESGEFRIEEGEFRYAPPKSPETREERVLEFEAAVGAEASGRLSIPAYAAYDVCLDAEGVCYRYRQDFEISVEVDPAAAKI